MQLAIGLVSPEWADIRVCLMISSTVRALKEVRVWLTLFHFQSRWICFLIGFATPCELSMVLWSVRTIAFDTFGLLDSTWKCWVALSLKILALGDTWIYIGSLNGGNVIACIEIPVDNHFSITTTLYILYINPNDSYVGFWRNLDNSRFWH